MTDFSSVTHGWHGWLMKKQTASEVAVTFKAVMEGLPPAVPGLLRAGLAQASHPGRPMGLF